VSKDYSDQIQNNFELHEVTEAQRDDIESVREGCQYLARHIHAVCPNGREKSLALTKLEEVMFWANAGIARQGEIA